MTSVTLTGGERAEDGTVTLRYDGGVIVLIHHDGHDPQSIRSIPTSADDRAI